MWTGVALLLSLVASFVFAGCETAITSIGELRIRRLLEAHQGPRKWLELWLKEPSRVLTTLLAGNTLANILASVLTTSLVTEYARRWGLDDGWSEALLAAAVITLTMVVLVAGEIAPKTLAKHHPERFLAPMHVVWWFHVATRWLTQFFIWVAMLIVRAMGGKPTPGGFEVTEEQIEDMVRIGSEAGSIDENRGDMLQNVFDMSDLPVRSIMTPRTQIDGLAADATLDEVTAEVNSSNFSRYPVYDKTLDKIVGIFNTKDLIGYLQGKDLASFRLTDHVREARFVPETKKVIELLKEFQTQSVHMAIVVDEHGGTSGIVTMEDVLEELVGEIYDEYDQPEPGIEPMGPNGWHIDAAAEIRDVADELDLELPENHSYSTVGGFLVDQLGHVPREGEEVRVNDLVFLVREADDTRVVRVEIRRLEPGAEPPQGEEGLRAAI